MNEFECGYINKPYCDLRPFNNYPSCPKFSCPPPLNCLFPYSHNRCSPYPFCCSPHQDFCDPFCHHCQPCQSTRPIDCFRECSPMNNLIWFYGGYRCGNKKSCHSNSSQSDFLKNLINKIH